MKTYEDGVRACVAALRADAAVLTELKMQRPIGSPESRRLEARSSELRQAADKLERTLLAEASEPKPAEAAVCNCGVMHKTYCPQSPQKDAP